MHLEGSVWLSNTAACTIVAAPTGAANNVRAKNTPKVLLPESSVEIKYRVLVADDHPLFREALVECVRRTIPVIEIVEAWDLASLQAAINTATEFDLLVLDLNMPGVNGLSTLVHVHTLAPGIAVIVVADVDDRALVQRAIALGAAGFIAKSALMSTIGKTLTTVLAGGISIPESASNAELQGNSLSPVEINAVRGITTLTPQQYRIATLLTWGMHNKQIAWELGIMETSVKGHISSIFQALHVRNRTQVAQMIQTLDFERSSQMQSHGRDWGML